MTSDFAQGFCCGAVSGGVKLCTRGVGSCTVKAHRSNKVKVFVGSLYIAAGRNAAYAQHHADSSGLSPVQLANVLKERQLKDEWVRLLHGLKLSQEVDSRKVAAVSLSAITPSKKRKPFGDLDEPYIPTDSSPPGLVAALSDDSETEGLVIISSMSSEDLSPEEKLAAMSQQWDSLVTGLNRLTDAFKRFRSLVSTELEAADERITGSDARIGSPPQNPEFEECVTAWDGVLATHGVTEELRKEFEETKEALSTGHASNAAAVTEVKLSVSNAFDTVNHHLEDLAVVVKALSDEQTVLNTQAQINVSPVSEMAFRELQAEVRQLKYVRASAPSSSAVNAHFSSKADAEIAALKIQLNILASRIPLDSTMSMGGHIFKSKGDVQLFVEKKMSTNLFHLCHDPITLLESLTGLHVEKKDVLNEMYQADRVGMNDAEARHCASCRLILPTVFGYVKEGTSTRHNLPAV